MKSVLISIFIKGRSALPLILQKSLVFCGHVRDLHGIALITGNTEVTETGGLDELMILN